LGVSEARPLEAARVMLGAITPSGDSRAVAENVPPALLRFPDRKNASVCRAVDKRRGAPGLRRHDRFAFARRSDAARSPTAARWLAIVISRHHLTSWPPEAAAGYPCPSGASEEFSLLIFRAELSLAALLRANLSPSAARCSSVISRAARNGFSPIR
jgi:hypothetical protein